MKILDIKYWIPNIKKKFWKRLSVFSLILAIATLIDEYIKEGVLFEIRDIQTIGTHESIVITLLVVSVISFIVHRRGGENG